jgi:hypothetical protein
MVTCPGAVTALASQQLLFRLLLGFARQALLGLLYELWDLLLRWRGRLRGRRRWRLSGCRLRLWGNRSGRWPLGLCGFLRDLLAARFFLLLSFLARCHIHLAYYRPPNPPACLSISFRAAQETSLPSTRWGGRPRPRRTPRSAADKWSGSANTLTTEADRGVGCGPASSTRGDRPT